MNVNGQPNPNDHGDEAANDNIKYLIKHHISSVILQLTNQLTDSNLINSVAKPQ